MVNNRIISIRNFVRARVIAAYIRDCCYEGDMENISLKKLSKKFALSQTALKIIFKQRYFQPIHAFVITARMKHIGDLLQTDLSIKEIALMSGYTELSNFSRDFSRYTGISPSAYRQQQPKPYQLSELMG